MANKSLYTHLQNNLQNIINNNKISNHKVTITCNVLTARQTIGNPELQDYPIIKGKEVMVEADFNGTKGQAFTDDYESTTYSLNDLVTMPLDSNKNRSFFIASLNAIYRNFGLCSKTVHCRNKEPGECALTTQQLFDEKNKVLIIGFQPGFINVLSKNHKIRVIDLNPENIDKSINSVCIENTEHLDNAIDWCDSLFVTGSTIVNGTITNFLNLNKPVLFYGVTISAAAVILNLNTFCTLGH